MKCLIIWFLSCFLYCGFIIVVDIGGLLGYWVVIMEMVVVIVCVKFLVNLKDVGVLGVLMINV